ncbi:unnamed protein product [Merluccius merluccius]
MTESVGLRHLAQGRPQVGECVFCAGQIALVPCTMELLRAGAGAQARIAFGHMRKVLEAVHSSLTLGHVLQAHCYVTRRQDVRVVREVWEDLLRTAREEVSRLSHL